MEISEFGFYLGAILVVWFVSRIVVYYLTLGLFKWLMPLKRKYGEKLWFQLLAVIPFWIGFLLDIYWNIVHFSFDLYFMNREDGIHKAKKFWPRFADVKGIGTLYKITLTERLQIILDSYPIYTRAYMYANKMRVLLNKYDPGHLTLRKKR